MNNMQNSNINMETNLFGQRDYCVSTAGLNQKTIEKYIREQEADDRIRDSISKREYVDPFKK